MDWKLDQRKVQRIPENDKERPRSQPEIQYGKCHFSSTEREKSRDTLGNFGWIFLERINEMFGTLVQTLDELE